MLNPNSDATTALLFGDFLNSCSPLVQNHPIALVSLNTAQLHLVDMVDLPTCNSPQSGHDFSCQVSTPGCIISG